MSDKKISKVLDDADTDYYFKRAKLLFSNNDEEHVDPHGSANLLEGLKRKNPKCRMYCYLYNPLRYDEEKLASMKLVDDVLIKTLQKETDNGDSESAVLLADYYVRLESDPAHLVKFFNSLKAVEGKGNDEADTKIGFAYESGTGTPADEKLAIKNYSRAIQVGNPFAMTYLAFLYLNRGTSLYLKKAVNLLEQAANLGVGKAYGKLGELYFYGIGVEEDEQKAYELYYEAANRLDPLGTVGYATFLIYSGKNRANIEKGLGILEAEEREDNLDARHALANYYLRKPSGIENPLNKAFNLFLKNAKQSFPSSITAVGYCYSSGIGTEPNADEAINWLYLTASNGEAMAQEMLGYVYLVEKKDYEVAVKWLEKAVDGEYDLAYYYLAIAYNELPENSPKRPSSEYIFYLMKTAAYRHVFGAAEFVGHFYESAYGVDHSISKAIQFYKKDARLGNDAAAERLGDIYCEDKEVKFSFANAMKYYRIAAENGSLSSEFKIQMLWVRKFSKEDDRIEYILKDIVKIAKKGYVEAEIFLAGIYQANPKTCFYNVKKSQQWAKLAAEHMGIPETQLVTFKDSDKLDSQFKYNLFQKIK